MRCGATSEPSHTVTPPLVLSPCLFRVGSSPPLPSPSPMARPRKAKPPPPPSPPKAAAPSLAEALLLAMVCMVGLPVEVQVRDGSAYAGVLHTACVDDGYGERTVTSGLSLPFSSKPARSRVSLSVAALGLMDHGIGVRDVIQQWVVWNSGCCHASCWPRFPLHPFDLLGGRVIVVAGSSPDVSFCSVGMDLEAGGRDRRVWFLL